MLRHVFRPPLVLVLQPILSYTPCRPWRPSEVSDFPVVGQRVTRNMRCGEGRAGFAGMASGHLHLSESLSTSEGHAAVRKQPQWSTIKRSDGFIFGSRMASWPRVTSQDVDGSEVTPQHGEGTSSRWFAPPRNRIYPVMI